MDKERNEGLPGSVIRMIGDLRASLLTLVESLAGKSKEADQHIESLRIDLSRLDPKVPLAPRVRHLVTLTAEHPLPPDPGPEREGMLADGLFKLLDRLAGVFITSYPSKSALVELRDNIEEHAATPGGNIDACLDDLSVAIEVIANLQKEEGKIMSDYINDVQQRLAEIESIVDMTYSATDEAHQASSSEHTSRLEDLRSIEQTVKSSDSLENLRRSMATSISTLTQRMSAYHKNQEARQLLAMHEVSRAREELSAVRTGLADKGREFHTDPLTKLPNRTAFHERATEINESWQNKPGLLQISFIMIDIDYFKSINDQFGHAEGDHVLCEVARKLAEHAGEDNFLARWGGEEFVVICPRLSSVDATQLAVRLRHALASMSITGNNGKPIEVTASFGIAELEHGQTMEHCFQRADKAMYLVKHGGRDGIACHHKGYSQAVLIITGRRGVPEGSRLSMRTHISLPESGSLQEPGKP